MDASTLRVERVETGQSLRAELVRRLSAEIRSGRLRPGDQLPTEQALMRQAGVSRTVVREAVAALRARGLVTTHQGRGAFVTSGIADAEFRIDPSQLASVRQVIDVMELRIGFEVEAAALAAQRRDARDLAALDAAHGAFREGVARGEKAVEADYALHESIARATRNPQYERLFEFIGPILIPRQVVQVAPAPAVPNADYLRRVHDEHERIVQAIAAGDALSAQAAMRAHLMAGLERYRRLAATIAAED